MGPYDILGFRSMVRDSITTFDTLPSVQELESLAHKSGDMLVLFISAKGWTNFVGSAKDTDYKFSPSASFDEVRSGILGTIADCMPVMTDGFIDQDLQFTQHNYTLVKFPEPKDSDSSVDDPEPPQLPDSLRDLLRPKIPA